MIALLNIVVPVFVIFLFWLAFKLKSLYPVLIALSFIVLYQLFQPSYMPKGTVKSMPAFEIKQSDVQIVDRGLKTKTAEQYDIERKEALEAIDRSLKEQIEANKERIKLNKQEG